MAKLLKSRLNIIAVGTLAVLTMVSAWQVAQLPAAEPATAPTRPLYWIFLTTGKSAQGIERAEIEKMQTAHLANFTRLFEADQLFLAGPMVDPEKKKRGIVVATAADRKALDALFETDPLIKQGYLTIDALPLEPVVGNFNKEIDAKALTEYQLVLLEKSVPTAPEVTAALRQDCAKYCASVHAPAGLCFAGWFNDKTSERRGILVVKKLDEDKLNDLLNKLPAVAAKAWKATTFKLYMSADVVK